MIADFLSIKQKLYRLANLHLLQLRSSHSSILAQIKDHALHEGDSATYETVENEQHDLELKQISSKFELPFDRIPGLRVKDVLLFYEQMAKEIFDQQEKLLFEMVDKSSPSVDGTQLKPSEAFLEVLRAMQIDFDEIRARPRMPNYYVNSETKKRIDQHFSEMTPSEVAAHEEETRKILDAKHEEYVLREGNRKLVD